MAIQPNGSFELEKRELKLQQQHNYNMNNEAIDKQLQPLSINGEQLSPVLPEGIKNLSN